MACARMVLSSSSVILALVLTWGKASAQEPLRFELASSSETRSCGDADVLRARISERIGRDPFTADADGSASRVSVTFAREKNVWTAEVAHHDKTGKRTGVRALTHTGPTCDPLVGSIVLTIAVVLEELAPLTEPTPAPERPPPPPPSPLEVPPAEDKPPPAAPLPGHRVRFDASIGATGALGGAPAPNAGGEGAIGLDVARFRLEAGARAYLPASSDGDPAVRTRLVYGRIAPCYGSTLLAGCLVVALGSLSGEGAGSSVTTSRVDGGFYGAGGAGALSRIFVVKDILFVRASVDVLASFTRSSFDVGGQRVWSLPVVGAATSIGIGARLP